MQLNLFFHALAVFCSLSAGVFSTLDPRARGQALLAAGFALGIGLVRATGLPDPVWLGMLVAALAVTAILRPRTWTGMTAAGGIFAGIWASMLQLEGLPLSVALILAAAVPALSAFFTRRLPGFAPPALREEALLLVVFLAAMVAIAPGVVGGWQSAAVLNLHQEEVSSSAVPPWMVILTLGAAGLGGVYTMWTRR